MSRPAFRRNGDIVCPLTRRAVPLRAGPVFRRTPLPKAGTLAGAPVSPNCNPITYVRIADNIITFKNIVELFGCASGTFKHPQKKIISKI